MLKKQQVNTVSFFTAGVITTVSITLVLFLLGATYLTAFVGKGFSSYLKENMGISIELSDDLSESEIASLQKDLNKNPYIRSAKYISKEEVKKQLVEDLGRDPEEVLGYNPAKGYFDVFVKADYVNADSMKVVEKSLKGKTVIKNVVYSTDDISMANANLSKIGSILLILALILVFISFTLVRNTIQLHIYSKRFLINTMRLVGATNSFIRRPFVLRTMGFGVIAAILANILLTGVIYYFVQEYPEFISVVDLHELIAVYVAVFLSGLILTSFATVSAVNKYLRMTTNRLYYV